MDNETKNYIDAKIEHMLDNRRSDLNLYKELRKDDALAVEVALRVVNDKMAGFPEQYALKSEQEAIKDTAIRLEKDTVSSKEYNAEVKAINKAISDIKEEVKTGQGRSSGQSATIGQIAVVLGAIVAFLTIVVIIANVAFSG